MRALLIVVALAGVAHAEPILATRLKGALSIIEPETYRTKRHRNFIGTRVNHGIVRIDEETLSTSSIAFLFDRPIVTGTRRSLRLFGEYEFLWLGPYDPDEQMKRGVGALPDNGHRLNAGLRMMCVEKFWVDDQFGVWLDVEAGGGAMVVDRVEQGVVATPHAFVGARFGFSLLWDQDSERRGNSDRWDYEIIVRGLVMRDGFGGVLGVGLLWGR